MNDENLKKGKATQFNSGEMAAREAQKLSVAARREKKSMRDRLLLLMEAGADGNDSNGDTVAAALMAKAKGGDLKAIRLLGEYLGEFKQKLEIEDTTPTMTKEEAEAIYNVGIKKTVEHINMRIEASKRGEPEPPQPETSKMYFMAQDILGIKPEQVGSDIMNLLGK